MPKKTKSRLKGRKGQSPPLSQGRETGLDEGYNSCDMISIPSSGAVSSLADGFGGGTELFEDDWNEDRRGGGDETSLGHTDFTPQGMSRDPGDLEGDMEEAMNDVGEKRGERRLKGLNQLYRCLQHIRDAEVGGRSQFCCW